MQQPQGGFGGFGGGQGFGGFQQQSWGGGFGGNQGFGGFQPQGFGFGGGYGGGFGNFGGFQPQQQFNPYQGGFGGFSGFGGGYNPMFGGIGGLGFNPMMGPQFGMPMGGFNRVEDRPTPQQSLLRPDGRGGFFDPSEQRMPMQGFNPYDPFVSYSMPMPGPTGRHSFDNPRMVQQPVDTSVAAFKNSQAYQDASKRANFGAGQQDLGQSKYGFTGNSVLTGALDRAYEDWKKSQPVQPPPQQPNVGVQAPMDGGGMTPFAQDMAQRQAQLQAMYGYSADMARQPELTFGTLGGTGEYDPKTGRVDLGTAGLAGGAPFTGPQRSAQDILSMAVGKMPQDMQYDLNKDGKITSADARAYQRQYGQQPQTPAPESPGLGRLPYDWEGYGTTQPAVPQRAQQTIADYRRQPMYGGIGGLGFNPMMGPQFGMPMQRPFNPADDSGMGAENARSARENMRNMSPAQMQNLQSLMQQLQGYGINSPQGQAMLG